MMTQQLFSIWWLTEITVAMITCFSRSFTSHINHDSDQYSDSFEEESEHWSSEDEEQEDPMDYCKGVCGRVGCGGVW